MLSGVFRLDAGLLEIVLRTAIIYAVLFLGLRLMGKRELGQMTAFDLVVILVISNAVQNALVGQDTSVTSGIVTAFTLLIANRLVAWARLRVPILGRVAEEQVVPDEILTAMRKYGVADLKQVASAVLWTAPSASSLRTSCISSKCGAGSGT